MNAPFLVYTMTSYPYIDRIMSFGHLTLLMKEVEEKRSTYYIIIKIFLNVNFHCMLFSDEQTKEIGE